MPELYTNWQDPTRQRFTCTLLQAGAVREVDSYKITCGAQGPWSFFRPEVESLFVNIGVALGFRNIPGTFMAFEEWIQKTKWVAEQRSTFPPETMGIHWADVMRLEIERLREQTKVPDFEAVKDKRMSELTPEEYADALEGSLRSQVRSFDTSSSYYTDMGTAHSHIEFLLQRLDKARGVKHG
jgi:hypothetical protein